MKCCRDTFRIFNIFLFRQKGNLLSSSFWCGVLLIKKGSNLLYFLLSLYLVSVLTDLSVVSVAAREERS